MSYLHKCCCQSSQGDHASRTLTSVIWSASMQLNVIIVYKLANLANCNQPVSLAIESVTQTATMIALNVLNFILYNRQLQLMTPAFLPSPAKTFIVALSRLASTAAKVMLSLEFARTFYRSWRLAAWCHFRTSKVHACWSPVVGWIGRDGMIPRS